MEKKEIFEKRESKTLEIKSTLPKFEALIRTCIAFANGIGGSIVIGVEDQTRVICGVDEKTRRRVYDEFPNSLFDSTSPGLLAQIYEKTYGKHSVLIITISPSLKKPCFNKREGMPKGVYLRVGSNTRHATDEYIEELMRESKRMFYDEEAISAQTDILSKELLKEAFKTTQTKRHLLAEKVIVQSAANPEKFFPTVAGVIHFNENPERYIPEATVLCTQFNGTSGRTIIQTQEISGPLIYQAETSLSLIESWIARHFTLQGAKLKGALPIPSAALRESIINALIHRKYFVPGAVKIALFDDRVEIFSPGGFPGLVDIHHLGDGTTFLRNPTIARLARKLGLVEKMGTGIRLILESCKKAKLRPPEFHEEGDFVKVILFFDQVKDPQLSDKEALLQLFDKRKEVTVSEVMDYLGVSRNTAARRLKELVEAKRLNRRGKGPSVRYYLTRIQD